MVKTIKRPSKLLGHISQNNDDFKNLFYSFKPPPSTIILRVIKLLRPIIVRN